MRADRLVAVLLILQAKRHVTAAEVAAELEVSERTARRDLEALQFAGLPVYSRQGRGGGWALAGRGKTDLSGLTSGEARALFLLAGPAAAATPEVKSALRKLLRALPEPMRAEAEVAAGAVVVDQAPWGRSSQQVRQAPAHLDGLSRAVVAGRQVTLGYVSADRTPSTRVVHPLGLAAKGSVWYLVAGTEAGMRTFRVDRVTSAEVTGDAVVRPVGFDLASAWGLVTAEVDARRTPFRARALLTPSMVGPIRWVMGTRVSIGPSGPDGRVEAELRGYSAASLANEVAGFGAGLEVLEPPEMRAHLIRIGAELTSVYGAGSG